MLKYSRKMKKYKIIHLLVTKSSDNEMIQTAVNL